MSALNVVILYADQFYYAVCPMDTEIGYLVRTNKTIQFNGYVKRLGLFLKQSNVIIEPVTKEIIGSYLSIDTYLRNEWDLRVRPTSSQVGISERLYGLDRIRSE